MFDMYPDDYDTNGTSAPAGWHGVPSYALTQSDLDSINLDVQKAAHKRTLKIVRTIAFEVLLVVAVIWVLVSQIGANDGKWTAFLVFLLLCGVGFLMGQVAQIYTQMRKLKEVRSGRWSSPRVEYEKTKCQLSKPLALLEQFHEVTLIEEEWERAVSKFQEHASDNLSHWSAIVTMKSKSTGEFHQVFLTLWDELWYLVDLESSIATASRARGV